MPAVPNIQMPASKKKKGFFGVGGGGKKAQQAADEEAAAQAAARAAAAATTVEVHTVNEELGSQVGGDASEDCSSGISSQALALLTHCSHLHCSPLSPHFHPSTYLCSLLPPALCRSACCHPRSAAGGAAACAAAQRRPAGRGAEQGGAWRR